MHHDASESWGAAHVLRCNSVNFAIHMSCDELQFNSESWNNLGFCVT